MYKHKNLKQLLCCLLLLCLCFGSSAALFSVNADTAGVANSAKQDSLTFLNSQVSVTANARSYNPYYSEFNDYGNRLEIVSTQFYTVVLSLVNNSDDIVEFNTQTISLNVNCPAVALNIGSATLYSQSTIIHDIYGDASSARFNTSGALQVNFGNEYISDSHLYLAPHGKASCMIVFSRNIPCNINTDQIHVPVSYFDSPVSSVSLQGQNLSVVVNNNIDVYNNTYNIHQITTYSEETADAISAVLAYLPNMSVEIRNNITNNTDGVKQLIQTVIDNQEALKGKEDTINSSIQSQTEQSEQQYNEFSAGSDSSDSSNISSTISGGTDAVKQKMGLFSFFDGIVNSMSDILTSDHERSLVLPALDVPLPDQTVHIWDRKEFDFQELENNFGALLTVVRFATVALCYSVMISGAYNLFHKFIGVKDGDA